MHAPNSLAPLAQLDFVRGLVCLHSITYACRCAAEVQFSSASKGRLIIRTPSQHSLAMKWILICWTCSSVRPRARSSSCVSSSRSFDAMHFLRRSASVSWGSRVGHDRTSHSRPFRLPVVGSHFAVTMGRYGGDSPSSPHPSGPVRTCVGLYHFYFSPSSPLAFSLSLFSSQALKGPRGPLIFTVNNKCL